MHTHVHEHTHTHIHLLSEIKLLFPSLSSWDLLWPMEYYWAWEEQRALNVFRWFGLLFCLLLWKDKPSGSHRSKENEETHIIHLNLAVPEIEPSQPNPRPMNKKTEKFIAVSHWGSRTVCYAALLQQPLPPCPSKCPGSCFLWSLIGQLLLQFCKLYHILLIKSSLCYS